MVETVLKSVNFGVTKTGLSGVGYTIYDNDGNTVTARTTSGISELGSTGVYYTKMSLDVTKELMILWDSGEGTPRYAFDLFSNKEGLIKEETDKLRMIWNTLKNTGDVFNEILKAFKKFKNKDIKDNSEEIMEILKYAKGLYGRVLPSLNDIDSAIKVNLSTIKIPEAKVPDIKFPDPIDYGPAFTKLENKLQSLMANVGRIPKEQKDYTNQIEDINNKITSQIAALPKDIKPYLANILIELNKYKKMMMEEREKISQMSVRVEKSIEEMGPTKLLLQVYSMLSKSEDKEELNLKRIRQSLGIK